MIMKPAPVNCSDALTLVFLTQGPSLTNSLVSVIFFLLTETCLSEDDFIPLIESTISNFIIFFNKPRSGQG